MKPVPRAGSAPPPSSTTVSQASATIPSRCAARWSALPCAAWRFAWFSLA